MSQSRLITADELLAMNDDFRSELVAGKLRKSLLATCEHGRISARIAARLGTYVEQHQLGLTFAAGTGFLISSDPDTVFAPDASFVSHAMLAFTDPMVGYLPLAPDLVVEIVSLNNSFSELEEKAASWLEAGSRIVILVDLRTITLRIYQQTDSIQILHVDDTFDAGEVVSGWSLSVRDAFGQK